MLRLISQCFKFATQITLSIRGNQRIATNKEKNTKMFMFNLSVLTLRHNLKVKKTKQTKNPHNKKQLTDSLYSNNLLGGRRGNEP